MSMFKARRGFAAMSKAQQSAREFDQPYYVTHQDEVSGGAVNV